MPSGASGSALIRIGNYEHVVFQVDELLAIRSKQLVRCVLKDLNVFSVTFHDTRTIDDITSFKTYCKLRNKLRV
jgi:hypothetical protein